MAASLPSRYFPTVTRHVAKSYVLLTTEAMGASALIAVLSLRHGLGLAVKVTGAVSVSFFRPEFDDFLYAAIGTDKSEMPLSVLSALSRLDIDPWEEAAELFEMPTETATQRLASLIARLPAGRWAQTDARAIAGRLIKLLPSRSNSKGQVSEKAHHRRTTTGSTFAMILLGAAFIATALIFAANREPASRDDHGLAADRSTSPAQSSVSNSR